MAQEATSSDGSKDSQKIRGKALVFPWGGPRGKVLNLAISRDRPYSDSVELDGGMRALVYHFPNHTAVMVVPAG